MFNKKNYSGINKEASRKRLFKILDEKGIVQNQLAEYLGISPSAVSAWRNQDKFPDMENLLIICKAIDVHMEDVLVTYDDSYVR